MDFRTIFRRWITGTLFAALATSAFAGNTESFTFKAKTYAGSRDRQYAVYVPSGVHGAAPLVMALHGCQQNNEDVVRDWGLTAAADRYGFILVTPFITSYTGLRNTNCWGFWLDAERHQGRGEAEDLRNIAGEVEGKHAIDPKRRYITGLSSGGAMAVVAAVTHNEFWAASAAAAGLPYGEDAGSVSFQGCPGGASFHAISKITADIRTEVNNAYPIPLMVLQNSKDCTVLNQAAINIRDSHLSAFGNATHNTAATARARAGTCSPVSGNAYGCEHLYYTVDGGAASRSVVETVIYAGPIITASPSDTDHGHYWIGGESGQEGKWAVKTGPSYPDVIWEFFSRHPRDDTVVPGTGGPVITLNGSNPMNLKVGDSFADPGATAMDAEDGSVTVVADCSSVNTAVAGNHACTYRATDSAQHTTTATRSVVVTSKTGTLCDKVVASPVMHMVYGRAAAGGWFNLRALSTGDSADIGPSYDSWTWVALYEGDAGWYAVKPAGCF